MLQRANHCRRKRKKERRRRKMKTMRRRMKSRRSYSVTSIPFHSGWRRRKSMVMALQQQNLQLELKAANTRLETTPLPHPPRLPTKHWAPSIPANRKVYHHQSLPLVSHNALCLLQPCWPTAECVSQLIWDVIWIQWGQRGGEGRREGQKSRGQEKGKGVRVGTNKRRGGKEKRWGKEIGTGEEDFSTGSFKHTPAGSSPHTLSAWSCVVCVLLLCVRVLTVTCWLTAGQLSQIQFYMILIETINQ